MVWQSASNSGCQKNTIDLVPRFWMICAHVAVNSSWRSRYRENMKDDPITATSLCMSQLLTPWLFLCPPHWSLPPTVRMRIPLPDADPRCGSRVNIYPFPKNKFNTCRKITFKLEIHWHCWVSQKPRQKFKKKHQTLQCQASNRCLGTFTAALDFGLSFLWNCRWFQFWNLQRYWTPGDIYDHRKYADACQNSNHKVERIFVWHEIKICKHYD